MEVDLSLGVFMASGTPRVVSSERGFSMLGVSGRGSECIRGVNRLVSVVYGGVSLLRGRFLVGFSAWVLCFDVQALGVGIGSPVGGMRLPWVVWGIMD